MYPANIKIIATMKKSPILCVLCSLFMFSCDLDVNFTDLTTYESFMMRVTVYFESNSPDVPYQVNFIDYQTNGYDQLISYPSGFQGSNSSSSQLTASFVVKEYKTVGIKIIPTKNIKSYTFTLQEIDDDYPDSFILIDIENDLEKEETILYDFEKKELIIE